MFELYDVIKENYDMKLKVIARGKWHFLRTKALVTRDIILSRWKAVRCRGNGTTWLAVASFRRQLSISNTTILLPLIISTRRVSPQGAGGVAVRSLDCHSSQLWSDSDSGDKTCTSPFRVVHDSVLSFIHVQEQGSSAVPPWTAF